MSFFFWIAVAVLFVLALFALFIYLEGQARGKELHYGQKWGKLPMRERSMYCLGCGEKINDRPPKSIYWHMAHCYKNGKPIRVKK